MSAQLDDFEHFVTRITTFENEEVTLHLRGLSLARSIMGRLLEEVPESSKVAPSIGHYTNLLMGEVRKVLGNLRSLGEGTEINVGAYVALADSIKDLVLFVLYHQHLVVAQVPLYEASLYCSNIYVAFMALLDNFLNPKAYEGFKQSIRAVLVVLKSVNTESDDVRGEHNYKEYDKMVARLRPELDRPPDEIGNLFDAISRPTEAPPPAPTQPQPRRSVPEPVFIPTSPASSPAPDRTQSPALNLNRTLTPIPVVTLSQSPRTQNTGSPLTQSLERSLDPVQPAASPSLPAEKIDRLIKDQDLQPTYKPDNQGSDKLVGIYSENDLEEDFQRLRVSCNSDSFRKLEIAIAENEKILSALDEALDQAEEKLATVPVDDLSTAITRAAAEVELERRREARDRELEQEDQMANREREEMMTATGQWKRTQKCSSCGETLELKNIRRSGSLIKRGAKVKNWKQRWFVLTGNHLLYFKKAVNEQPRGCIHLDDLCTLDIEDFPSAKKELRNKFPFLLATPQRVYFFVAELAVLRFKWVEHLNAVIRAAAGGSRLTRAIDDDKKRRLDQLLSSQ